MPASRSTHGRGRGLLSAIMCSNITTARRANPDSCRNYPRALARHLDEVGARPTSLVPAQHAVDEMSRPLRMCFLHGRFDGPSTQISSLSRSHIRLPSAICCLHMDLGREGAGMCLEGEKLPISLSLFNSQTSLDVFFFSHLHRGKKNSHPPPKAAVMTSIIIKWIAVYLWQPHGRQPPDCSGR